jgi:hypothetical protein
LASSQTAGADAACGLYATAAARACSRGRSGPHLQHLLRDPKIPVYSSGGARQLDESPTSLTCFEHATQRRSPVLLQLRGVPLLPCC